MTGPEHYQEAECLLRQAYDRNYGSDEERYYVAAAQVHATLALAAATALRTQEGPTPSDWSAWRRAAGTPRQAAGTGTCPGGC